MAVRRVSRQTDPASRDQSLGSVLVALAANTAIAVAKGTAAALTGSPALLAETLHTVADAGNEVLLYVAIRRSRHPADASHPFGYGPERYYWALLAAIGMFVVGGAVSIWEGISALVHPRELEAFWVGVAVLVLALVLDGLSRLVALRQLRTQSARRGVGVRQFLRETPDPTVVTVYFEDTVDVLGAALALVAVTLHRVTGSAVPDALGSIVIGGLLCYIASRLTGRNRQLLTYQSVPDRYVQRLRARLEAEATIRSVTRLEAVYLGPTEVLVAADVEMSDGLTGGEVAAALARIRADLARAVPVIARFYLTPVDGMAYGRLMADLPRLIIQVPRGGAVDRQLSAQPLGGVAGGDVVVETGPTDAEGHLVPPVAGTVVLSVPSPETLAREADNVRRAIAQAGTGVEPLVVVVEAAEELRDDELAAVLEAAGHSSRPVIMRIIRDG